MTVREFEALKEKIESAKIAKARAEGAKDKVAQQFKTEFGISIENYKSVAQEKTDLLEKYRARKEKLITRLNALCDWDSV